MSRNQGASSLENSSSRCPALAASARSGVVSVTPY
jgi:hypothetical protein